MRDDAERLLPDISVVTVSYNVAGLLRAMLRSIVDRADDGLQVELIVVDNASVDDSVAMVAREFPDATLIRNADNRGFGAGCNQGIAVARGRYVFLLNPDASLGAGGLRTLYDLTEAQPKTAIVAPRLLWPDGTSQSSRRRFPTFATLLAESTIISRYLPATHSIYRRFYMVDIPENIPHALDWVVGAALFCRRAVLEEVGGFDERFFMYSEELDLCRRVATAGWRVVYTPAATVTHLEGQSSKQDIPRRHIMFQTSKVQYVAKYYPALAATLLRFFLLSTYLFQGIEEGAKWLVGHKRGLRRERLAMVRAVLRSGLKPLNARRGIARYAPTPQNIAFVTAEYPPQPGGVGDYTACVADALREGGARVSVLTGLGWTWRVWRDLRVALAEKGARLAVIEYQTGAYRMHPAINLFPLYLRLVGGADRPRIVATFHDIREPYLWPKAGRARRWANALLARGADAAIFTTHEDADAALARYGLKPERAHLMPIGSNIHVPTDDHSLAASAQKFRLAHNLSNTFTIGYFGLLNPSKGATDLVQALAELRKDADGATYRVIIIGGQTGDSDPTNKAYARMLDEMIAERGLGDIIVRTGHLAETDVSAALAAQDVVVLPFTDGGSLRRGSLLAAMVHARPVITTCATPATAHSSESEVLRHAESVWLVPPADASALAVAIRTLRADPALRDGLGTAAKAAVADLRWSAIAARHLELYTMLVEHG